MPVGTSKAIEFRIRHRSGDWRWFRSYNTPFRVDENSAAKATAYAITEKTAVRRQPIRVIETTR